MAENELVDIVDEIDRPIKVFQGAMLMLKVYCIDVFTFLFSETWDTMSY